MQQNYSPCGLAGDDVNAGKNASIGKIGSSVAIVKRNCDACFPFAGTALKKLNGLKAVAEEVRSVTLLAYEKSSGVVELTGTIVVISTISSVTLSVSFSTSCSSISSVVVTGDSVVLLLKFGLLSLFWLYMSGFALRVTSGSVVVATAEASVVLLYLLLNGGLVNLLMEGLKVDRSVVGFSVDVEVPILNLPLGASVFAAVTCSSFCSLCCCCLSLSLILFKLKRGLVWFNFALRRLLMTVDVLGTVDVEVVEVGVVDETASVVNSGRFFLGGIEKSVSVEVTSLGSW